MFLELIKLSGVSGMAMPVYYDIIIYNALRRLSGVSGMDMPVFYDIFVHISRLNWADQLSGHER